MRALIFGTVWILVGKRVWFFPNILAEEATLGELFRFWPKKDEEERPKWTARLFYAIVAALVILLLRHHAPDEAARARSVFLVKKFKGEKYILIFLCWQQNKIYFLSEMRDTMIGIKRIFLVV